MHIAVVSSQAAKARFHTLPLQPEKGTDTLKTTENNGTMYCVTGIDKIHGRHVMVIRAQPFFDKE